MDGREVSCQMEFHPAIIVGIFTMNLADGWMDGIDNRHTDGWTDLQVESHWVDRQMSHVTEMQTDLSCNRTLFNTQQ